MVLIRRKDVDGRRKGSRGQDAGRGGRANDPDGGAPADSFADDPLDPMLEVKKRARRRLIGAIALVIGAIVFVPMIFDSEQKREPDDIVVQIPDKNAPFTTGVVSNRGTQAAPAGAAGGATQNQAPAVEAAGPPATHTSGTGATTPSERDIAPESQIPTQASASSSAPADGPGESRPGEVVASEQPAADTAAGSKQDGYAVQIGAFSDPAKVRFLSAKLASAGLKSYTEPVNTTEGERTRLRLGPYATREAADKVQVRVRKLFALNGTVVPI